MRHEFITRDTAADTIAFADVAGAFSYALDLTDGQPAGHSVRCCYIAGRVAELMGLAGAELAHVHYTALLKDLGCSSNAARIAELYLTDDRAFKHRWKTVPVGLPAILRFVFRETGRTARLGKRLSAFANVLRNGEAYAQEMIVTRCTRGADIARVLRRDEAVVQGIYHLDEHWDGSGRPDGLRGQAIPLPSRLALLAQVADVFLQASGREAAAAEVAHRAGSWLDPEATRAFATLEREDGFWRDLASPLIDALVAARAPVEEQPVGDDYLDAITAAFGQVIDAKSPYTAGHSARVADIAQGVAGSLDVPAPRVRQLRRAAALHDIGKLGVSSAVLEKPGRLDEEEWVQMREHAAHTARILGRVGALGELAELAAAHHERLDGAGYPLGLHDREIRRETRIITVCDYFDALTSDRPYRAAVSPDAALAIMKAEVGTAVDPDCFAALKGHLEGRKG